MLIRSHRLCVLLIGFFLICCTEKETAQGPEAVVRQFLRDMGQLHGEGQRSQLIYDSLWSPAREHLLERARRASALSGRAILPEEMIAPSRFSLRFSPERFQVRVVGKEAEVVMWGPLGEQAQTRCVKEDDGWKIALDLPPLQPIQARQN